MSENEKKETFQPPQLPQNVHAGDEVETRIRGQIVDINVMLTAIRLVELEQQGRVQQPVIIYVPTKDLVSAPLAKDALPPQVPA